MFKVLVIMKLLVSLEIISSQIVQPDIKATSYAISSLIDNLHEKHYLRFKLVVQTNDSYLEMLANKIMRNLTSPIDVQTVSVGKFTRLSIYREFSYVFLLEKQMIDLVIATEIGKYTSNSIVFITYFKKSIPIMKQFKANEKSYKYFWLQHSNESLYLSNGVMAQIHSCKSEWKTVASFNSSSLKWNTTNFITEYEDFFGCSIKALTGFNSFYYWLYVDFRNGKLQFDKHGEVIKAGVFKDLLDIMSKKYNTRFSEVLPGSELDLELFIPGDSLPDNYQAFTFTFSVPMGYEYKTFIVSRGEQYTPFEKLLLPFDLETWIIVIVIFFIGYFTIFIVYQFLSSCKQIVFGENIKNPSLSLTQIFFGIGLIQSPGQTFARVIFMIFTLYCLIIRTAYQGKMFDFLHSNAEKKVPETMQDLLEQQTPMIMLNGNLQLNKILL
jgi:hypothetical protein